MLVSTISEIQHDIATKSQLQLHVTLAVSLHSLSENCEAVICIEHNSKLGIDMPRV